MKPLPKTLSPGAYSPVDILPLEVMSADIMQAPTLPNYRAIRFTTKHGTLAFGMHVSQISSLIEKLTYSLENQI
jgi:hypothetical protein